MTSLKRGVRAGAIVVFCAIGACAQSQPAEELKFAIVVSRHGVRSPTWTPERLNQYSSAPWPDFGVEPGELTKHGRALMTMMGGYYRAYFGSKGLPVGWTCADAERLYFRSDTAQRTRETAKALAEGILPGCPVEVHSTPEEEKGEQREGALAVAALKSRLGPDLDAVTEAHRSELELLQRILVGTGKAKHGVFDEPVSVSTSASLKGPLSVASTLSEDFLLEYTDGMSGQQLGWGRLNNANLLEIMSLHTAYAELTRRTPTLARERGGELLQGIVRSLEQAATSKAVSGALSKPETALLVIAGHDTNLSNLSGLLGLSWLLPGYQADDAPPGGALLFTLWRSPASGQFSVRLQFVAQTPDQMHDATPLSLERPPAMQSVFLPGCSTAGDGNPCSWVEFRRIALAVK